MRISFLDLRGKKHVKFRLLSKENDNEINEDYHFYVLYDFVGDFYRQ